MVDMCGAATDGPLEFALECVGILEASGITPPSVESVFGGMPTEDRRNEGWGRVVGSVEYDSVLAAYAEITGAHHGESAQDAEPGK